jgi:hypothetical protein
VRATARRGYSGPFTNVLEVSSSEGVTACAQRVITELVELYLPLASKD